MIAHRLRNGDTARLGDAFQTGRDIDAIAVDVGSFDNHVAEIDADTEFDAAILRHVGIRSRIPR